jgi:hypothetical protein
MTNEGTREGWPFEKVTEARFELKGLKTMREAAYLQYKLLLLEPVIRAHIDFPKKSASIIMENPTKNTKKIAETLKPVKAILKDKKPLDYNSLVEKGYHQA